MAFPHMTFLKMHPCLLLYLRWPTEEGALYTVVLSNLDINNRKNRWEIQQVPSGDQQV